jgi:hypothetical protein
MISGPRALIPLVQAGLASDLTLVDLAQSVAVARLAGRARHPLRGYVTEHHIGIGIGIGIVFLACDAW